jgi:hypothetical protein
MLGSGFGFAAAAPWVQAKASIALEGDQASLLCDYSPSRDFSAAMGLSAFLSKPGFGGAFARLDAKDCVAFAGKGTMNDWRALKAKPSARVLAPNKVPWSKESDAQGSSLLFGLGTNWLRCVAIGEPGDAADLADLSAVGEALHAMFRFGGVEIAAQGLSGTIALAAGIADSPRGKSGEGWRAGSHFRPGSSSLTLATMASTSVGKLDAGAWVSASAGYFQRPGIAFAIELALGDVPLCGEKAKRPTTARASAFLCGSSQAYRTMSGDLAPYDCLADLNVAIERKMISLAIKASLYSLPEAKSSWSGRALRKLGVSPLQTLLWLWRTDLAKGALELRILASSLTAQAIADSQGFRSASIAFGYAESGEKASPLSISASLKAAFSRENVDVDEDEKLGGADESELEAGTWLMDTLAAGALELRSIDLKCGMSWRSAGLGRVLQSGSLALGIGADWIEGEAGFSASFALSQTLRLSPRLDLLFALKSPEGGYALDVLPNVFPRLAVELAFWTD